MQIRNDDNSKENDPNVFEDSESESLSSESSGSSNESENDDASDEDEQHSQSKTQFEIKIGTDKLPRFSCTNHKLNLAVRSAIGDNQSISTDLKKLNNYMSKKFVDRTI